MTTTDTDALTERIRDEVYGTWVSSCCDGAVINIDEAAEIAADLIPIVAVEVRKAKAEALREAAARIAEEKRLRMKATAAATEAEARIKAVEDVLDSIDTSTEPALHDGFADIRRALDGTS